ncbi:MAG: hypothetical protein K2P81_15660 [Bacteriovoracaceae bacterium]|nr:hypothetical protein [Bacteriovoracaceae bacterium]
MESVLSNLWDWSILTLLIVGAIYTLRIIRQESTDFLEESYLIQFGQLSLPIPQWWSISRQENQMIEFKRADTRYDWFARFEYIKDEGHTALTDILHQKIESEELDYDKDDVVIETNSAHLFKNKETQLYFTEVIRVEGKASLRIEERVYLDLYLFRNRKDSGYYMCESRSSVLNGLVEGPFFEECLSHLNVTEINS